MSKELSKVFELWGGEEEKGMDDNWKVWRRRRRDDRLVSGFPWRFLAYGRRRLSFFPKRTKNGSRREER